MSLSGETALITGASRGIGYAIARELGLRGARVIGTATSEAGLEGITKLLTELGINGAAYVLDVSRQESVDSVMAALAERGWAPSVLVNNAGITRDNLLLRMSDAEWDAVLHTNLSSVFRMCRAVMKPMIKARHGRIINLTSVVGVMGNAGQSNYAAAKAGIIGFTKSLARELGSRSITVNAVAPGFIDTDMTRALPQAGREALLAQIPLGRLGEAAEIAAAVAFLASREAGYITGQTLHVNGGMLMP